MKKMGLLLTLLCVVAFLFAFRAYGSERPLTWDEAWERLVWEIAFEDGSRIFYMTPSLADILRLTGSAVDEYEPDEMYKERLQIRSGLYYNVAPPVSIYYVDE